MEDLKDYQCLNCKYPAKPSWASVNKVCKCPMCNTVSHICKKRPVCFCC